MSTAVSYHHLATAGPSQIFQYCSSNSITQEEKKNPLIHLQNTACFTLCLQPPANTLGFRFLLKLTLCWTFTHVWKCTKTSRSRGGLRGRDELLTWDLVSMVEEVVQGAKDELYSSQ